MFDAIDFKWNDEEKEAIKTISIKAVTSKAECEDYPSCICLKKDLLLILNLIQKQQTETEKKDKIIDLQVGFLYELGTERPGTVFKKLWDKGLNEAECAECRDDNKKCTNCIKQYFEREVENEQ